MDRRSSIGIITKASFLVGILPENILLNALKSDKKGEPTDFAILFELSLIHISEPTRPY